VYDPIFENPSGLGLADFVINIDLSTGKTHSTDFGRWFDPVTCERACRYALFTHVLFEATPATAQFTSLEIKEIYCFSAENSLLRMYIVTNQGEYVYCYNYDFDVVISQGAIIEHLMPASKFYELAKTSEHKDYYGYNVAQWPEEYRISEVDWEEYIRSNFQK
jgi:hypothetical protein